jgi:prepilin-type N-terminal cleavage/methylation domain-containing protein
MRRFNGFTLIEVAMVVVVIGLLLTILIGMSASLIAQQRAQTTRSRLANIDTALALFVAANKRLPCPADGRVASATGGEENLDPNPPPPVPPTRLCAGNQQHGVVPWRALGLSGADIEDGWGTRFTYRVGPALVHQNAMDFTNCDPAGGTDDAPATPPYCNTNTATCNASSFTGCTSPGKALVGNEKGVIVKNVAGNAIMDPRGTTGATPNIGCTEPSSGAAYVVISHGPEGGGGYNDAGTLVSSSVAAGTAEARNFANLAYTPPVCSGSSDSYLVDDAFAGVGTSRFDDIVSRPAVLTVAGRAQLGPRAKI